MLQNKKEINHLYQKKVYTTKVHNLQELTNNAGFTFTQNKFPIVTDSIEFKQFQTPKIQKNKHVFFYDSQTNLMDLNSGSKEEINKKAEKVKQENGMQLRFLNQGVLSL